MKTTHKPYGDIANRIGSELKPLTWGERIMGVGIILAVAILTVEGIKKLIRLF